ncbi:hypothetical protein F5Y00DRAFT_268014 [Daldinia vernicosa]|uniref:uncharacterized protein n=1 Tax=Daldinia vernicosa TaxID=114800 RepID=UPI0020084F4C|nr:uncharacterized protein F5Y00DRAFT_268014 [Daldinia vernicosa]KAI0850935.1 hypothetical protein F5Y00DRAFT_268014 [Daldinia vernicosa]
MHSTMEVASSTAPQLATDSLAPEVAPETYHPQYYEYKNYGVAQPQTIPAPREAEIAGLKKPTFWLLVALFSVVALALGLGTGLGLGLRSNDSAVNNTGASANSEATSNGVISSPHAALSTTSSTSTVPTTSSSTTKSASPKSSSADMTIVAEPTPTVLVDSRCPSRSGSLISGENNRQYKISCDSDLTGTTLASLVVNSLEECLALCDSLNWVQKRSDVGCVWNEKGVVGQVAGTCWCKGGDNIKATSLSGIVVASPAP